MTTKILGNQITSYTIDTVQLSNTATATFAKTLAPKVLYANVASNIFTVLDDTAVNVGGGYIVVTGAEFQSGATVLIDTTPASAVTYVNSTTLQVQVPTKSAASYNLYVVNPDGGVGIKVAGITYSSEPTWVTSSPLNNQVANTAFNVTLSANGATSYAVAAGSTLPAGTTLAANGYFSGTVSIGAETTYTFSVVATDAELQDANKTFQVTVTVTPITRLFSWGGNTTGVLGQNDTVDRSSPVQVGSGTNWSQINGSIRNFIATKTDGTLWTWGTNTNGQLGLNDRTYKSSPTQVGTGTNWNRVNALGTTSAMATKTDGTLWAWGQNNNGQLGLSDVVDRSSPVQVGTETNWNQLSTSSGGAAIATKTDGTLWTWGSNFAGILGNNSTVNRSSPTQVGAATTWSLVSSGNGVNTLATKTDGTLWLWGYNAYGQLGLNDKVYRSSPVQLGVATNWSQISVGRYSVMATKTDGTLWAWGTNTNGQLGGNNTVYRSSPTQVGSGTDWNLVSITRYHAVATKTDGTLWAWGANEAGQLGQNNVILRSSPTQIGTATNWSQVTTTHYSTFARTS